MSIWPHLCSVYVDALWPALNPVVIITSAVFGTGISCQHTSRANEVRGSPSLYLLHGARRWENHPIGELTCPGLEVKFYYFTIYFTIPHGSALLVLKRWPDLFLFYEAVINSQCFEIPIEPDLRLSLYSQRGVPAAFFHPSFQQLSQTPEYEAVCAISQRRACLSMLSVHVNSSARSVWRHGLDGVCRLLLWDVSLDCSVNEILLHRSDFSSYLLVR